MYSIQNEGKSVITGRFIRTLKYKIYKYMTAISKSAYINKLDCIVTKFNNTYHKTIKMKPVDIKSSTHTDSSKEANDKDSKFKVRDFVRISKFKHIFAKGFVPNCWNILWKRIAKNKLKRVEKVLKKKEDKLYVKWKDYNGSFSSWIDKKDIV